VLSGVERFFVERQAHLFTMTSVSSVECQAFLLSKNSRKMLDAQHSTLVTDPL